MKKRRYSDDEYLYDDEYENDYEDDFDDDYDEYNEEDEDDYDYEDDEKENDLVDVEAEADDEILEESNEDINDVDEDSVNKIVEELRMHGIDERDKFENNEAIFKFLKDNPDLPDYERENLLNEIAKNNYNTIYYIANKHVPYSATLDDLIEAGQVGYAKAIANYDPDRGVKFSTFAINCIQNEIRFHLRKVKKYYENDISTEAVRHKDKNGNDLRLEDVLADNRETPEELSRNEAIRNAINDALRYLTPRERHVMIYRFALQGEKEKTQNEIAALLGMSQANISKIEKNCLEKLKELLAFKI